MKIKHEPRKRKPIREIETRKNFSGEQSPYWDFIANHQRQTDEGNPIEDTLANPDMLSEDEGLHNRPLSEEGELRLRVINETIKDLSPQQQKVIELCGFNGMSLNEAAVQLGVKKATVQALLARAKQKIMRSYDREKGCHTKP